MLRRASLVLAVTLASIVAPAAPARADARADRAQLLLQVADLTDRSEASEAGVVLAQLKGQEAEADLRRSRSEIRRRALESYVTGVREQPRGRTVYIELAQASQKAVLTDLTTAVRQAETTQRRAEEKRDRLHQDLTRLAEARRRLDQMVAADDARRADEAADRARAAALAAAAKAQAQARVLPQSGPYDPSALTPRHRKATAAQIELMSRYQFGPGPALPAGLNRTGSTIEGVASWYGPGFHGRATASGAIYDQEGWTVASRTLPLGTLLWISRGDRHVLVVVNDRGPYVDSRVLDLSHAVATTLGFSGIAVVRAEVVVPG